MLYIGDTAVSPVVEVPVPEKRYNTGIDNLLGTVDASGAYQFPTEPFTPDFSKVKSLPNYALYYKFYQSKASGDLVFGLETLSGGLAMYYAFYSCDGLTSVSFPALTTVSGNYAMSYAFYSCDGLTSVSFPALTTVSGESALSYAFSYCDVLTSVSFPMLQDLTGIGADMFAGSKLAYADFSSVKIWNVTGVLRYLSTLETLKVDKLEEIQAQVAFMPDSAPNTKLTSLDFPSLIKASVVRSFNSCTALKKVWIPSTCTVIQTGTATPTVAATDTFLGRNIPTDCVIYTDATGWQDGWDPYWHYTINSTTGELTALEIRYNSTHEDFERG